VVEFAQTKSVELTEVKLVAGSSVVFNRNGETEEILWDVSVQ